jgi:rsbT co-antagonist protein RsbR
MDDQPHHNAAETSDQAWINRQKLALHIQHTPLAYIEWNLNFEVVEWNPAAERIFGYTRAEALGRNGVGLIVAVAMKPAIDELWANLLKTKTASRNSNQNITSSGQTLNCEWHNAPLLDANDTVVGMISIVQNVTDQRQSEQKLALYIQQMPLAYIETLNFNVVEWNPAAERIFGYTKAEALGHKADDLILSPDVQPVVDAIWNNLLESKEPSHNINANLTKDGRTIYCEWYNTPLMDSSGTMIGIVTLAQDITQQRSAEEAHQRLQEQIITLQRAALAELSTPLIPINDQIVVMPLIGSIDTARAQDILNTLLQGVSRTRARVAILDITGIPLVDTQIANALVHAAQAVQLLGAQVVLTGIRPEVAQTLVGLGVNLQNMTTRGTLQSGIAYAMQVL